MGSRMDLLGETCVDLVLVSSAGVEDAPGPRARVRAGVRRRCSSVCRWCRALFPSPGPCGPRVCCRTSGLGYASRLSLFCHCETTEWSGARNPLCPPPASLARAFGPALVRNGPYAQQRETCESSGVNGRHRGRSCRSSPCGTPRRAGGLLSVRRRREGSKRARQ